MQNFLSFGLPEQLVISLTHLKFETPTPIQHQVIPDAMKGSDILGSAQTGTGKTGAFGIPLVSKLLNDEYANALVMTPTRELAVQVLKTLDSFLGGRRSKIKTALLIGGEPIGKQFGQLKSRPRLIVGTPGRINDHIDRGSLILNNTNFLVLDETDRMLDMGFVPQIDRIVSFLPAERQTLLFSATLPKNIVEMSKKYLKNPVRVSVGEDSLPAANLSQEIIYLSEDAKYDEFINQLNNRDGSVIVFVKTKVNADKMAKRLRTEGYTAEAIHGDLHHGKRERVVNAFRSTKFRILVATDIAARGLDISHVKHVVNYDLPQCPEDFIHRIGRTARAGADGEAVCFVTPEDRSKWFAIKRIMNFDGAKEIGNPIFAQKDQKKRGGFGGGRRRSGDKPRGSFGFGGNREDRPSRGDFSFGNKKEGRGSDRNSSFGFGGKKEGRSSEGRDGAFGFGDKKPAGRGDANRGGRRSEGGRSEFGGRSDGNRNGGGRNEFGRGEGGRNSSGRDGARNGNRNDRGRSDGGAARRGGNSGGAQQKQGKRKVVFF
ncbi:MAG: DEAD/DEAH box helicase [Alphaproteobacteria bacterium]|nr:DEAD/DEAH box helicase [Alphaproteobacteria bacterium]OJV14099.1 MAG: hypothetical protein BGO27_01260 [Alphaproteobacteria bacterium 33-17]